MERVSPLIPKFKQQLIFLEEHQKLFKNVCGQSIQHNVSSSGAASNFDMSSSVLQNSRESPMISINSPERYIAPMSTNDCLPKESMDNSRLDQSFVRVAISKPLQDDYKIPLLPSAVVKDVELGNLEKFGPHCANRQILIDAIVYDLLEHHNLFYPTHKQFDDIGNAIVKYLKLPLTKQNIAIWKDALQTKLKRKRFEHRDNQIVQEFRLKYSRTGSGRPVKRKIGETAERDRYKQMVTILHDNQMSHEIQEKSNQLRDASSLHINTQLSLWKETLPLRRKAIRDQSTADIMKDFPGYSNALLVFEEIKLLTKVDLSAAIRRQIPILLDKIMETPVYISDSSPIRLIKTLCRHFGETLQHTLCDTEPLTPYPTLVSINGLLHIYVDFIPILETDSPDEALALLIAMYTIFELNFDKKSRTIRLLYSTIHEDKRFLSNSIRLLIKEKQIDIYYEQQLISSASVDSSTSDSTSTVKSQILIDSTRDCTVEYEGSKTAEAVRKPADDHDDRATLSGVDFQNKPKRKRKNNVGSENEDVVMLKTIDQQSEHSSSTTAALKDVTNSSSRQQYKKKKR